MGKHALIALLLLATVGCSTRPSSVYKDPKAGVDRRVEDLLRHMSETEKFDLLRFGKANARLGIPALRVQTAAPASGLALEATWNPEIVRQVATHADTAFGYYGEDPWLASRMAVAWTSAVQADERIGTMLNFPCAAAGQADARALNEIYYPPYRSAIEEAGLWSVTTSCPGDQALLDWGFRGFIVGSQAGGDEELRRVLRAMFAAGLFDDQPSKKDPAELKRVERIANDESVVLLKNEGNLLPLYSTQLHTIGVVGTKEEVDAIRQRAGATPIVEKDNAADVTIVFNKDQPLIVKDDKRVALLESWGNAAAATDVIFGDVNPSGKLPITVPKGAVAAHDGIYAGYRYFDKHGIEPLYPFGFGLSYTTFDWSDLRIFPASPRYGQTVQVVLKVKNTGLRAGAETVELYIHQVKSSVDRPPKELKAFARVELKPGEERDVAMTLDRHSMSFYDPQVKDWATEPGVFEVLLGTSSRDIRLKGSFELFP
jgi:hypothetical protein